MAGPMTWELAEYLGNELGRVALLTGHPDTLAKGSQEKVVIYPAAPYLRGNYLRRILSWLRYLGQAVLWLWRWPPTIPLLLFSNPPFLPWLGYLMHHLRNQSYAVMVHDIYPDVLVRLKCLKGNSFIAQIWNRLNRVAYEQAKVVLTLGESMATSLTKQFDPLLTKARRVEIVYPWADTEVIHPIPKGKNWFARQYGQVGKLTVMYSGNMGIIHDIETMLAVANKFRAVPNVHFMFIGAGPKWQLVSDTLREQRLQNVTLLPWQAEEIIPFSLTTADVALISIEPAAAGLAVPSKFIYSIAAGSMVLVLATGDSEVASWVHQYDCGKVLEPGDIQGVCDTIESLLKDEETLKGYKNRVRSIALQKFSRSRNNLIFASKIQRFLFNGETV
jgi:glycosyltransferase involved in cell wall biosynthesis